MKKEYDFSKAERGKFYRPKKVQRTLRIDADILQFFEKMAEEAGIPYQTLINLTLRKFANEDGEIVLKAATSTNKPKRA
ncbi:MAG: BrnA antitoxin family protein [Oligoflexales bacterium]|nr:BrnA antitoxin family protein [Oligoflexales bacterium]